MDGWGRIIEASWRVETKHGPHPLSDPLESKEWKSLGWVNRLIALFQKRHDPAKTRPQTVGEANKLRASNRDVEPLRF